MKPILRSAKNAFDFFLRNQLDFKWDVSPEETKHALTLAHQKEIKDFLNLFFWSATPLFMQKPHELTLVDVGTRTFAAGPAIEEFFQVFGQSTVTHGIELDAHRRFSNFHSRADYGRCHARNMKNGFYHCMDFLDFNTPADIILMLHPFVTEEPLVRWGLPLKEFKPQSLFNHSAELLKKDGLLLLSSPNQKEFELACHYALNSGYFILEKQSWFPGANTTQKLPRIGALMSLRPGS